MELYDGNKLKFPVLSKNDRPMTLNQFKALEAEQFTDEQIINKLDYMEARKRFNHDYTDVYRVCRNWLLSDRDPNYRDRFRKKKKEEPKKKKGKKGILSFVVILLAAIIGGLVYYYFNV